MILCRVPYRTRVRIVKRTRDYSTYGTIVNISNGCSILICWWSSVVKDKLPALSFWTQDTLFDECFLLVRSWDLLRENPHIRPPAHFDESCEGWSCSVQCAHSGASTKRPLLRTLLPFITVLVCVIPCIIYSWTKYFCWGNGSGFHSVYNLPEHNVPVFFFPDVYTAVNWIVLYNCLKMKKLCKKPGL